MVEIAERLRVLVRETVPDADERAYTGWHAARRLLTAAGRTERG